MLSMLHAGNVKITTKTQLVSLTEDQMSHMFEIWRYVLPGGALFILQREATFHITLELKTMCYLLAAK